MCKRGCQFENRSGQCKIKLGDKELLDCETIWDRAPAEKRKCRIAFNSNWVFSPNGRPGGIKISTSLPMECTTVDYQWMQAKKHTKKVAVLKVINRIIHFLVQRLRRI